MKICKKCGIDKELTEFTKMKLNKSGLSNTCKKCSNEYNRLKYNNRDPGFYKYVQKTTLDKLKKRLEKNNIRGLNDGTPTVKIECHLQLLPSVVDCFPQKRYIEVESFEDEIVHMTVWY